MYEPKPIRCTQCGELHDPREMEVAYAVPDDYFKLSLDERNRRGKATRDFCQLDDRYFIRSVAPVPIEGSDQIYCWGIWAEVSEEDFRRAYDSWNDHDVSHIPRIPARLANAVPEYEDSLGLAGEIELRSETRPFFYVTEASRFREDQREGVTVDDTIRYHHHVT